MRRSAAVRADDRLRPDENTCPLRFKLDPTSDWDGELIKGLAETRFFELLDVKGHYEGSMMEQPPDPTSTAASSTRSTASTTSGLRIRS
jgi:hypothetical protein